MLNGSHFGPRLRELVLYQHHHCQVTQPLLHEQLREWGVDISVGQVDALLSGHNAAFCAEKDQLLATGLQVSPFVTVDDSGARHRGHNGYVTQIGNDRFAWFSSTASKSRINFPELLHAGDIRYGLNQTAHARLPRRAGSAPGDIATPSGPVAGERHRRPGVLGSAAGCRGHRRRPPSPHRNCCAPCWAARSGRAARGSLRAARSGRPGARSRFRLRCRR